MSADGAAGRRSARPALVGAAGLVVAALGGSVFDAFVWEFVVAAAIVAAVALVSGAASTPVRAASVVASVVVGVAASVVLAGGSVADALWGMRGGPRRLLSTEWPSPAEPTLVATVAFLVAAATAVGVVTAQHRRWRLAPLVPLLVAATVVMALSAPVRPAPWLAVMLVAVCVAAGLEASDAPAGGPVLLSVGVIVLVAVAVSTVVEFSDRADPRRTDDAVTSAVLLDPVEATVAMRDADPVVDLLTISVAGPDTRPSRWRTSAFDTYDGQRWTPEVDLRPIGGRLAEPPSAGHERPPIDYEVRYLGRSLDVVPTPGRPLVIDRDVATDLDRVVVRLVEPPDDTTSVTARALPAPTATEAAEVGLADRQVDELSAGFTEQARTLAGEGTRLEQLGRLAATMRDDWQLDSAAPGAGQQLALIDRFVSDTRRGTREQFVTGFVLLARSLGADARIAAGFVVPPGAEPAVVRTDHAGVWPEVRLTNGDWLALDPVPTSEAIDADEPPPPPDAQTPAAAQPPIAPPVDDPDRDDDAVAEPGDGDDGTLRTWIARAALTAGVALGPILTVLAAIVVVKWKRRRRRAAASDPAMRVRGYWANATDSLVDAGLTIEAAWTDDTIATAAADVLDGPTHEARRLAAMATAVTFGSPSGPEARLLADDAAASCAALDGVIRASRTRWERARWRLSLRSLRRPTRSPVTV